MSDPLRIALVAEGPTDTIVIQAALEAIINSHEADFILTQLQPSNSDELGGSSDATQITPGGGWHGVYKWCHETAGMMQGVQATILNIPKFEHDYLIIHLDVDVSRASYSKANIIPFPTDSTLPCNKPCPPASTSADALREVITSWLCPVVIDERIVFCLPADNIETWCVAACKPSEVLNNKKRECHKITWRADSRSVPKTPSSYRQKSSLLKTGWLNAENLCPQAHTFADAIRGIMSSQIDTTNL